MLIDSHRIMKNICIFTVCMSKVDRLLLLFEFKGCKNQVSPIIYINCKLPTSLFDLHIN